jgi:phosphohistidine swiveling domain-containing protein
VSDLPARSAFVRPLDGLTAADAARFGGKAAGLGALRAASLPVPRGAALAAEALTAYLDANGLDGRFADDAQALAALRAGAWPEALAAELRAVLGTLGPRLAVRSSAPDEDGAEASFAGQHLTVLDVAGFAAVADAVLRCWASAFAPATRAYRRARGVAGPPTMAVVIQDLVPADAAGVAFTVDPVTGDAEVIVVDAAPGLGEALVAGTVTPDHYRVRRAGLVVEEVRPAAVVPPGAEATGRHAPRGPALTTAQARAVAALALRCEDILGGPQDIEWALAGGDLFLLQSRPVTTARTPAAGGWVSEFDSPTHPETVWTAANIQEVLPGQVSPLTWSLTGPLLAEAGRRSVELYGARWTGPDPFCACFYGRAFLNVTAILDVGDQSPLTSPEALHEQYFGGRRPRIRRRFTWKRVRDYARTTTLGTWTLLRMPAHVRRAERIAAYLRAREARRPYTTMAFEEVVAEREALRPYGIALGTVHLAQSGAASASFEMLRGLCERWLGDDGRLHATFVSGLSGVESALISHDLWALSRIVAASSYLAERFAAPAETGALWQALAADAHPDAAAFRAGLDAFLARHGHRSVLEGEVAAPSWRDDVPAVLALVRNYLALDEAHAPPAVEARRRAARERAERRALARLRPWQRPIFRRVLRDAQRQVAAREHTKSLLIQDGEAGRRAVHRLAALLVARGLLARPEDIVYLTWPELLPLWQGALTADDAAARIARRRREEVRNRTVRLPEVFTGRPVPLPDEPPPVDGAAVLRGIPVSPGRVTGRARVIFDPRRDAAIAPGEILVAPVTDAGWTPLFISAAAVVVDIGGPLSHGSTVAREFGLPAVVGVRTATRRIRDGQVITVDGTHGLVLLADEG